MKIEISPAFLLTLALSFLLSPLFLLFCILLAAAIHESGHLLLLSHFGVRLRKLRFSAFGIEIDAPGAARLCYAKELLVTLGGIAANVMAALFFSALGTHFGSEMSFVFAGANAVLAAYNLLPIPPLDGSRALFIVTAYLFGLRAADLLCAAAGVLVSLALVGLGAYVSLAMGAGYLFAFGAVFVFLGTIRQLALAKGAVKV